MARLGYLSDEQAAELLKPPMVEQLSDTYTGIDGLEGYNITPDDFKTGVSLDQVENKSSATIRGEITGSNVTTALGYTPYNATNPNGYITGNQTITFSGDASGTGTTSVTLTLATVNSNTGTWGSSTQVPVFTVDGKGRITAASNATITPAFSSLTGTPTTLSGYGITDAVPSSRTVSTTAPLAGGGALSGNLTLSITAAALTKTDDTNVTLTLGGSPTTALLAATSLTLGWTGQLSVARGGTGSSSASGARTNLGLVIGTDVQAYNANLTTWAGKTAPSGTVVGTSDTQTLTNKTYSTPVIDGIGTWTRTGGSPSLAGASDFVLDGSLSSGTLFLNAYCSGDTNANVGGGSLVCSGKAFRPPAHTSDPASPTAGDMYYNSATGKFRGYNGFTSTWNDLN